MKNTDMKTYYLKIREKFIEPLRNGTKKHEYRLANPERRSVKVGDNLVLISNQNNKEYVRTTVTGVNYFKSWQEALTQYWKEDFKGLFDDLETAINECRRFYKDEDVKKYGIVVFDVKPIKVNYLKSSVLLDTNIIIKRESVNNTSYEISELYKAFDKNGMQKYIHQKSKEELEKYANPEYRKSLIDKLGSYSVLPHLPISIDKHFENVISQYSRDENGETDNALLCEVYNDNVGILLTDDNLILKKAEQLYIRDRVLSSTELLKILKDKKPKNVNYDVLNVKLKPFGEIDLSNGFFDSLREDYNGQEFDRWYKRKASENAQAYVFEDQKKLKGFLYLKIEENDKYDNINPPLPTGKWLKVGTFKIDSTGIRLGERFIKIIFDNARLQKVDNIYVTLFENKRDSVKRLKQELEEWGFVKYGENENGEAVLVKKLHSYDYQKSPKFNFPNIKENSRKFFLPIDSIYHTSLFPDSYLHNEDMNFLKSNKAHQYALEKIYLTGKRRIGAKPGDMVLIYRIGEEDFVKRYRSAITGVAVVQEIVETNSVEECIGICKNRSIFSEEEIRRIHQSYSTIVKVLFLDHFEQKVTLHFLREKAIIEADGGPRPFQEISDSDYELILDAGKIGEKQ